jgi:hypothetical protein
MPYFGRLMGMGRIMLSDVISTTPSSGRKKVTNLYYDPNVNPALAFTGSAGSYTEGDLSGQVIADSPQADIRFKNISDIPLKVWYRKTGTSGAGENADISPQESTGNIIVALTTARTVEYKVEGGGTIECWVANGLKFTTEA